MTTRELIAKCHDDPESEDAKAALCAALIREGHGPDLTRMMLFNAVMGMASLYGSAASTASPGDLESVVRGMSSFVAGAVDDLGLDGLLGRQVRADTAAYLKGAREADRRGRRPPGGMGIGSLMERHRRRREEAGDDDE